MEKRIVLLKCKFRIKNLIWLNVHVKRVSINIIINMYCSEED